MNGLGQVINLDSRSTGKIRDCKVTLHMMRCSHGPYVAQVKGYATNPKTIGEAIRKRRLDLTSGRS